MFGTFLVDPGGRQLLNGNRHVHVSPKAFDLLQLLLSRRPNAVSKAEIQDALWPSAHVVEANVANLVGEIRRVLEDDSEVPRYVRTVPRFGYAFIHPVRTDIEDDGVSFMLIAGHRQHRLRQGPHPLGRSKHDDSPFKAAAVSRRHACIVVTGALATIEDLGSKNGTFVNGVRLVGSAPLIEGDIVRLGTVDLTFCSDATEARTYSVRES